MLLGAPWVWDPAQHRVLSYPPGIDFTSKRETQLLVVIEANRVHCELIRVAPLVLETLGAASSGTFALTERLDGLTVGGLRQSAHSGS